MGHYVVVDLEMCKTYPTNANTQNQFKRELIQIGAVLLDSEYRECGTFDTYVAPEFGRVDTTISRLTGITLENTKNAPSAKEVLERFAEWLPDNVELVAWSQSDEKQLKNELLRKGLDIPKLTKTFGNWVDCQELFGDKLDTDKQYRLSEALSIADIPCEDGAHNALVDAKNTARLFAKLQTEEKLILSPYLIGANSSQGYSFNPFSPKARQNISCS